MNVANKPIIRKLTTRKLSADKKRNFFVVAAIALTALLITSMFSIGVSFYESLRTQEIRLAATTAHMALGSPDERQMERLKTLEYVKTYGVQVNIGEVELSDKTSSNTLYLSYVDKTAWQDLTVPAISGIQGAYPEKTDEIMLSRWALELLGISEPKIGMDVPVSYRIRNSEYGGEPREAKFTLSGWYTSYVQLKFNGSDMALVSKSFLESLPGITAQSNGAAFILFRNSSNVNVYVERLKTDLAVSENQSVMMSKGYALNFNAWASTAGVMFALVLFFMLGGYLLIYNVLYISVSRDTRFYGLLKTLGTTPKQIRRIVRGQVIRLCLIGIPIGFAAATIVSFVIIPAFVARNGIETGSVVSFSPFIYIGAAVFVLLTTLISSISPAKTAARVSPIEAVKYTEVNAETKPPRLRAKGKPYRMALRNIARNRKRAAVVLLSLFLGLTMFITVVTFVSGVDEDRYAAEMVDSDVVLTYKNGVYIDEIRYLKGITPFLGDDFIGKTKSLPGIVKNEMTTQQSYFPKKAPEVKAFLESMHNTKEDKAFWEILLKDSTAFAMFGIDMSVFDELTRQLGKPLDAAAFARGDFALVVTDTPEDYANLREISYAPIVGSPWGIDANQDFVGTIAIGGVVPVTDRFIRFSGPLALVVSNDFMKQLYTDPTVCRIDIELDNEHERQTVSALEEMTQADGTVMMDSRWKSKQAIRESKTLLYALGGGIAAVLGLIGILNFVNVMSVGVIARRRELATLESIGMSKKQLRSMLRFEGVYYAAFALVLAGLPGNAVALSVFGFFERQDWGYMRLDYPMILVAGVMLVILAVCVITPALAYRSVSKSSVVERLHVE